MIAHQVLLSAQKSCPARAPPGAIARRATRFARIELPRRRHAAQSATELCKPSGLPEKP